jgi:hypothetical protein
VSEVFTYPIGWGIILPMEKPENVTEEAWATGVLPSAKTAISDLRHQSKREDCDQSEKLASEATQSFFPDL